MMSKLYLVHGNTYYADSYGHEETVFGIFTEKERAEAAKAKVIKRLYDHEISATNSYIDDISDIDVDVLEIESNKIIAEYLGGYCE